MTSFFQSLFSIHHMRMFRKRKRKLCGYCSISISFFQIFFQLSFYTLQRIVNGLYMPPQVVGNFLIAFTIQIITEDFLLQWG